MVDVQQRLTTNELKGTKATGATACSEGQAVRKLREAVALILVLLTGCGSDQHTATPSPPRTFTSSSTAAQNADADAAATSLRLLAEELNSARLAARKVETLPAVQNPLARRDILLNVALYRAAYQTRISRQLDYIVLEPVIERDPPDIGIDPEEFRLRILGALDNLPTPVAWVTETWRSAANDYFPGTDDRATRLRITVLQRNDNQGVVLAEVSDWTNDLGASKQKVTCTWDGLSWNLERDPVRMVW